MTKVLIFICFILTIPLNGCKTVETKEKLQREIPKPCSILDTIVNVTHDTIEVNTLFSSNKYGLFYFDDVTDEYAPFITSDGITETLWFTSSRMLKIPQQNAFFWDKFPFRWICAPAPTAIIRNSVLYNKYQYLNYDNLHKAEVFYSTRAVSNSSNPWFEWSKPDTMTTDDNDFNLFMRGPLTTLNGTDFIIAADRDIKKDTVAGQSKLLDLYEITYSGGTFTKRTALPNNINIDGTSESHPALLAKGNDTTLFFVSDRPGGKGGNDIWYSKKINGKWGNPINLTSINSASNDEWPHCGSDGKFYFSSDRSGGLGGKDIYVADFDNNGVPIRPINFNDSTRELCNKNSKFPLINTADDEISPFMTKDKTTIYYSSNRKGAYNKPDTEKNYDLYACYLPKGCINFIGNIYVVGIRGTVLSKDKKLKYCITGGTKYPKDTSFKSTTVIELEPNTEYTVKLCNDKSFCCSGNEEVIGESSYTFKTGELTIGGELIVRDFKIKCKVPPNPSIIVGASNFATGYWYPMTTDNYNDFQSRFSSGFFKKTNCISKFVNNDFPTDSIAKVDAVLDGIKTKLYAIIANSKCKEDPDEIIMITVKGFTDERRLSTPRHFPEVEPPITSSGYTITTCDKMDDLQEGNIYLSILRAQYTQKTIDKLMQGNEEYKRLLSMGKIKYKVIGNGIDQQVFSGPNPKDDIRRRRVEINIVTGNVAQIDTTTPKIDFGPYKWDYTKEELPECQIILQYTFNHKEQADFVHYILKDYLKLQFTKVDSISPSIFTFRTESTFPTWEEANKLANKLRDTTSDLAIALKNAWPNRVKEDCYKYGVSFGWVKDLDEARIYQKKYSVVDSSNKVFIVKKEVVLDQKTKVEEVVYAICIGKFATEKQAEKYKKDIDSQVIKAKLWNKFIEVITIYCKNEIIP
jgi:hypothetical protein